MEIGILGGGIAGLSVALALHKLGYRPWVYERRAGPATMGAGVTLWPNAGFVLEELGLLHDIGMVGGRPVTVHREDAAGNGLGGLDVALLDRTMGYPTHTILRRDLQAVLLEHAARAGIQVKFGCQVVAIELEANGTAVAQFANGTSICPDLLIGADGRMDSVARKFVAGDNTPIYQGFINWIGVAQGRGALVGEVEIRDYWGSGERFGCVAVRPDLVYWAAAQARPSPGSVQAVDMRREMEALFAEWPDPVARVIQATPLQTIREIAVHDLEPLHSWSRANVLLIGDAAHAPLPTSGQGACQALEDAWHFARCLAGTDGGLQEVFRKFTKIRGSKTARLSEQGRAFARGLFATDPETCRMRNERAKASDPRRDVEILAAGWAEGLPMSLSVSSTPVDNDGLSSLYRS